MSKEGLGPKERIHPEGLLAPQNEFFRAFGKKIFDMNHLINTHECRVGGALPPMAGSA